MTVATNRKASEPKPWYRQVWPWLVMLPPVTAVIAGISTVIIANTNPDSLVIDDFQKVGLVANRVTARDRAAQELGIEATVAIDHVTGNVTARLTGDIDSPSTLRLSLHHPTQPDLDVSARLRPDSSGLYRGQFELDTSHRWYVQLQDDAGRWRLTGKLAAGQQLLTFNVYGSSSQ